MERPFVKIVSDDKIMTFVRVKGAIYHYWQMPLPRTIFLDN